MPSYSPVYSAQFIVYTTDTPNEVYDVPVGFTAVVRQVTMFQDIGGYTFFAGFTNAVGAPGCAFVGLGGFTEFVSQSWEGRVVVPGGGQIYIGISELGSAPAAYVGGYLLRNELT